MYRFVCQVKIGEKISTAIVKDFENKDLRFETWDEALYYYCEHFDERELMSWWPTYDKNNSYCSVTIKHVDNV